MFTLDDLPPFKKQHIIKYKVVGLIPNAQFQQCCYVVKCLYTRYPKKYHKPEIRPMLNLAWDLYLTKMRRRYGEPFYLLQSPVVVYSNGKFIGDDKAFMAALNKEYRILLDVDFEIISENQTIKYFQYMSDKFNRKFVYFTIAKDHEVIGSMLFMLYNDLVPKTCEIFLSRCIDQCKNYSYKGCIIQRIAKYSWIQCGGFDLHSTEMPCENYAVHHDRKGVLSMCNKRRHEDNNTQFFITLEKAPWMDYNYVAFGQLIQGVEILQRIEEVPTTYEYPSPQLVIAICGEFSLCPDSDLNLNPPHDTLYSKSMPKPSQTGQYHLETDLKSYTPVRRYSKLLDDYLKNLHEKEKIEEQSVEEFTEEETSMFKRSKQFYGLGHSPDK